jgi:general transcription factor 3C polypeptide 3 (transcription factor C subunit 4)
MYVGDINNSANYARWFMQMYQFRSDPYRLYYLALRTGAIGAEQFRHAADQKFLLRQIKAIDSLLTGEPILGAASISQEEGIEPMNPRMQSVPLLTLYGHRLASGGSFAAAQSITSL